MTVEKYICKSCGEDYASRKDPNAVKIKDRPQCGNCGERWDS